mgnify:CR=1 FL=1|jgi:hypothetical protein
MISVQILTVRIQSRMTQKLNEIKKILDIYYNSKNKIIILFNNERFLQFKPIPS